MQRKLHELRFDMESKDNGHFEARNTKATSSVTQLASPSSSLEVFETLRATSSCKLVQLHLRRLVWLLTVTMVANGVTIEVILCKYSRHRAEARKAFGFRRVCSLFVCKPLWLALAETKLLEALPRPKAFFASEPRLC